MKTMNKTLRKSSSAGRVFRRMCGDWEVYLMALPVIAFYLIFCYYPMYGALIAFQDYIPGNGFIAGPWVGLKHFIDFIQSADFWRLLRNTLSISIASLVVGFPAPIILALLINEIRQNKYKRVVQSITYIPHFISLVVVCGMIKDFVGNEGIITNMFAGLRGTDADMLTDPKLFMPIHVISGIWQEVGWGSIIYLSALSGVDPTLYEAAQIDGAGKWKQLLNVTIPGILPTIVIMLVMKIGGLLSVGYEKIILLYNPLIYETADVISAYVYRMGFEGQQWSYTSAIGIFNSVINFTLIILANQVSKKLTETSLW